MTVNLMRYIDHWLGIPLCFLLSCLNPLLKIFGSKKTEKKVPPEKIFFIKLSELGAIVLAHPLLKRARKEYPGAELFFVTFEKNRGIFALLGNMVKDDNIFTIREDSLRIFIADTFKVIRKMRRNGSILFLIWSYFPVLRPSLPFSAGAIKK